MTVDERPRAEAAPAATDLSELECQVFQALATLARSSSRREVDVAAALHRAGLHPARADLARVLATLGARHAIARVVPLSDGGLLLTVPDPGPAAPEEAATARPA